MNKENDKEEPLVPYEEERLKNIAENNAKLNALGLGPDQAKASGKRPLLTQEEREAKKRATIEQNWAALRRVGTRVKVPASIYPEEKPPAVRIEPTSDPSLTPL